MDPDVPNGPRGPDGSAPRPTTPYGGTEIPLPDPAAIAAQLAVRDRARAMMRRIFWATGVLVIVLGGVLGATGDLPVGLALVAAGVGVIVTAPYALGRGRDPGPTPQPSLVVSGSIVDVQGDRRAHRVAVATPEGTVWLTLFGAAPPPAGALLRILRYESDGSRQVLVQHLPDGRLEPGVLARGL